MQLVNGRAFKPQEWKAAGLPIIRIQNLNDTESSYNYYSGQIEDKHRVEPGTLLFAWSGTTGTSFGARVWNGPSGVLNQHIFKVLPDQSKMTLRYALLVLRLVQEYIEKEAHGFKASFVHVKKSDLVSIHLPLPSTKAEQEAIAEASGDADALIESLEQLVAKKRQIKHGAMQELLTGRRRLPGFTGKWEVKRLEELGETFIGLTYTPAQICDDGILVLRSSNIQGASLIFADNVFVNAEVRERLFVRAGDILICVRNGSRELIGKCAKIDERAVGMTFGAFMAIFRSCYSNFVFQQFQSDVVSRQIREHLGATINQITNRSLNSFVIPFPTDSAERDSISSILSDMDDEIAELEVKLAKARQVKQGMMQELLTGRIRLIPTQEIAMQNAEDAKDEAEVVQLAVQALTEAQQRAVKAGHPIVCVQNGVLVRLEPNGTRTELKNLPARQRITLRRMHKTP
jgi:type I restriction enzyme S subunit